MQKGIYENDLPMHMDFDTFLLNDHLPKIDRSSMIHGIEARNPFLDYRIYELAYSSPKMYKYSSLSLKKCLKLIGTNYSRLAPELLTSAKKGLTIPLPQLMASDTGYELESLIMSNNVLSCLINSSVLKSMFEAHRNHQVDFSRELWSLSSFALWSASHPITL